MAENILPCETFLSVIYVLLPLWVYLHFRGFLSSLTDVLNVNVLRCFPGFCFHCLVSPYCLFYYSDNPDLCMVSTPPVIYSAEYVRFE